MNNQSLNFFHKIPFEIYHDNDTVSIEIFVNNNLVYENYYTPGTVHRDCASFYYEYHESQKSCIKINFYSNTEAEKKYLKIKSVDINGVWLNLYNANYKPKLNPVWWNSLDQSQKDFYLETIYGKNGNTFGWFGEISFDFATGIDNRSCYMLKNNIDTLLSKKIDWVFLDNTDVKQWESSNNDKLL